MICEVCGIAEQAVETDRSDGRLHVCVNCINDRQLSVEAAIDVEVKE